MPKRGLGGYGFVVVGEESEENMINMAKSAESVRQLHDGCSLADVRPIIGATADATSSIDTKFR